MLPPHPRKWGVYSRLYSGKWDTLHGHDCCLCCCVLVVHFLDICSKIYVYMYIYIYIFLMSKWILLISSFCKTRCQHMHAHATWGLMLLAPKPTGRSVEGLHQSTWHVWLGGGFKYVFVFIPIWGNDPIWWAYFSDGLKPPTSWCLYFFRFQTCARHSIFTIFTSRMHWTPDLVLGISS